MLGSIPVGDGTLGLVLICLLLVPPTGWMVSISSLNANISAFRRYHPSLEQWMPASSGSRYDWMNVVYWSWTSSHRKLTDRAITRMVLVCRIVAVAGAACVTILAICFRELSGLLAA